MENKNDIRCALCGEQNVQFNLKLKSKYSETPLISIIENVAEELLTLHFDICLQCYDLLNELDAIELRQTEIRNKFRRYIEQSKHISAPKECNEINFLHCDTITENSIISELSVTSDIKCDILQLNTVNTKSDATLLNSNIVEAQADPKYVKFQPIQTEEIASVLNPEKNGKRFTKKKEKKKPTDDLKPHKCHCSKEFRTAGELKNHTNSHSDHRAFICEICGQSYKHKNSFNVHMDMHKGINPFICVYCNKAFTQKGALARHVPIHTGDMPYQCDECGKRFVHHTSFNIHRLSHTGLKSYKCTVCGLALMSTSHLKRHMRIHTGEKKFACGTCGKRFAEKYNLAVHEKLHANPCSSISQKRNYGCRICGVSFERKVMLDEHLVKKHQIVSKLDNGEISKRSIISGNGSCTDIKAVIVSLNKHLEH